MKTQGSAVWQGGLKDGKGAISTKSGALKDYPYGFASRFEGKPGTNPEELIGAAHAGCFTMALYWHKADIEELAVNVRFRGKSGHQDLTPRCPLMTQSGHRA